MPNLKSYIFAVFSLLAVASCRKAEEQTTTETTTTTTQAPPPPTSVTTTTTTTDPNGTLGATGAAAGAGVGMGSSNTAGPGALTGGAVSGLDDESSNTSTSQGTARSNNRSTLGEPRSTNTTLQPDTMQIGADSAARGLKRSR